MITGKITRRAFAGGPTEENLQDVGFPKPPLPADEAASGLSPGTSIGRARFPLLQKGPGSGEGH